MIDSISLLIPTMNRPETLRRTLQSYFSAEYVPNQVVVVDQSSDRSVREQNESILLQYAKTSNVKYVYQQNASLTKARNNALRYALNDIIVFSDDDIDVFPDTLDLVRNRMQDTSIAMIAGIDDRMQHSNSIIGYFLGTKSYLKRNIGHVTASVLGRYPNSINGLIRTEWAMGYFFVVRKSLLEKWNITWDERLTGYAYAEDLDFSYRYYKMAEYEGLKCIMDEKIHVVHLASQEYRIPTQKHTMMYVINRGYIGYKHHMGWKSYVAFNWCNLWMLIMKVLRKEAPSDMLRAMKLNRKLAREHYETLRYGEK